MAPSSDIQHWAKKVNLMCGCMKNGTKELVKRVGAIHDFAGETNLFLLISEDDSSECSTEKGTEAEAVLGNTLQLTC